jgi:hypothetical protein
MTLVLGKTTLTKKAHQKNSCPRAGFNGRLKPSGWPGKDGSARERVWARHGLL